MASNKQYASDLISCLQIWGIHKAEALQIVNEMFRQMHATTTTDWHKEIDKYQTTKKEADQLSQTKGNA